ncbi:UDP-3-O-(3-hydroxymyristoyl)glucosamine N-acyltransferase [Poriferisphaera corsica]|uniref:UDP-3-O-(3-hydroxymyristoyl)glucosamine N-acyltransferase n=1 Tax=Poriferisphaera corsica TaxID=2528020 RepID=A0A517YZH9_9BACT|nr:putative sugar nucleotidyl transferase [Poriferisphaera corsica]QDU35631.1 UDP-3-O-(3-hydroxymyristoyl)glucosamine N-acyltransferase [Poriferisphaera corsica]
MGQKLYIFDDGKGEFGPLADRRAIFEMRTGAITIRERIERTLGTKVSGVWVKDGLYEVMTERVKGDDWGDGVVVNELVGGGDDGEEVWMAVNGRWNAVQDIDTVKEFMSTGLENFNGIGCGALVDRRSGDVIAMKGKGEVVSRFLSGGFPYPHGGASVRMIGGSDVRTLLERPWHALDEMPDALLLDLAAIELPVIKESDHVNITAHGSHEMRVASSAKLLPYTVVDATYGPVVIDEGAEINPLTVLQGPCYVGPNSVLVSHTSIRRNTVIGPWCKVGGEISGVVMQGYSNKVHDGFLGMAMIGEWVNLGANTNVSNLKNTYGKVRIRLREELEVEDSGRQFQGPIVGDFVRTGIGTRVNTGAVLGSGCMFAGSHFTPKYAKPFGFYTDGPDGMVRSAYEWDKFVMTAKLMMERRGVMLTGAEEKLLREIFEKANHGG